ncbi:unnamed protein product [Owenia fusiformis]|uniref:glucuronosyl-galactosyl-proteoglycan 4-alpha-N-acetylglucosaminyltransferase n=1 Tax=Owenia fusiformis TaxID=6347 RepID=A0A8J1U7P5_OWEFU|nr:unnamed protein product [Owenia fusiformis]
MAFSDEYHSRKISFQRWLTHVKLSRLIGILLVILIIVPLIAHYYISNIGSDGLEGEGHRTRSKLDHIEDSPSLKSSDLKFRIEELRRIKASVNNELRDLENTRQKLNAEISGYNSHIEKLKHEYESTNKDLDQLKLTMQNTRLEQEDVLKRNMLEMQLPHRILPSLEDSIHIDPPKAHTACAMHTCFDYSRCSISSGFPVYFYSPLDYTLTKTPLHPFIKSSVMNAFNSNPHSTFDPHIACIYVILIGDLEKDNEDYSLLEEKLKNLPYWHGDGRNHLLLNLAHGHTSRDIFEHVNTGRAMIVQSTFISSRFRAGFDVIIPPSLGISHGDSWEGLPMLVPARRQYLLTFLGEYNQLKSFTNKAEEFQSQGAAGKTSPRQQSVQNDLIFRLKNNAGNNDQNQPIINSNRKLLSTNERTLNNDFRELINLENGIVEALKNMQSKHSQDGFYFDFKCNGDVSVGLNAEWALCLPEPKRHELLEKSTFSLIIAPTNYSIISSVLTQIRIFEAIKYGAIPIILGDYIQLPFNDYLLWKDAVVQLPKSRITELHFIIRSFIDNDILALRRQGRIFYDSFFSSTKNIIDTLLAVFRTRLQIPAPPIRDEPSPNVFNASFVPLRDENVDIQTEADDILGPIESPLPSLTYRQNFTFSYRVFNQPGDYRHSFPFTPFIPVLPAEAKFKGSSRGFRPIGKGAGGAGKEFNEALGGNFPREQFTIVMLTYEREAVLMNAIARLKGLPHLNRVVVVWNSPKPPAEDLRWPIIGVDVHVIRTEKNSLNNRFLPYDVIETEAILSIDDDAHLRHDEIMFGFRVWRENRERIVGFPGRFHAWDLDHDSWLYNSNYSCELSMVLTGAAFFHKYYAYLYSYVMPQAIRDKVDEYVNCEDLALNFLVSHITRQPPIKVTSRWTFRCPGCPKALSVEDSHFHERHKCMNFFVKIYGYMPLLYTQFRVDSVLFKTRIPHDKQKCFKFI